MLRSSAITKTYIIILLAAAFALPGCMVGPDYQRPETIADTSPGYVYVDKTEPDDPNSIGKWWLRFGDETTVQLVNLALKNNYDLQAAAARVLQAEALLAETRGRQLPQISYGLGRTRSKMSFNFSGERFSNLSTTWSQDINASYIIDLFGQLKRATRAAWANLLASEASQWAVQNALIAAVVRSRVNIATLQRQAAIARANTANWRRNNEIIQRRYERGLVGPIDVRLARENLANSEGTEYEIQILLRTARNALDVLLARAPGSGPPLPETLPDLPDLAAVPAGLPAHLLDRRPDVKAAEYALQGASERIGVSIGEMFPKLVLGASYGRNADTWEDIWTDKTEVYSAIFDLAQPIFRGGQLKARVKFSEAVYEELAANYAQTVVNAMADVENALMRDDLLQKRLVAVRTQFEEATAAEKLSGERYLRGVDTILIVLETERRRRLSEDALNLVKGRLWANRIDLFLALGGDWTPDLEVAATGASL